MTTRLEKPVRRLVNISGIEHVVEISRAGVTFRRPGHRHRLFVGWRPVQQCAERLAGEDAWRELLSARAVRRIGR